MSVAYCIAAHTRPPLTLRLVRRLIRDDPDCLLFLYFDQRSVPFDLREVTDPRARLIPERSIHWGGPEIVDLFVEMLG